MQCPNCGSRIKKDDESCKVCGKPLKQSQAHTSKSRSWSIILIISTILITAVGVGTFGYLSQWGRRRDEEEQPAVEQKHTFKTEAGTEWDTELGLEIIIPSTELQGMAELSAKRGPAEEIDNEAMIASLATYDLTLTSEQTSGEYAPPATLSFSIPEGVNPHTVVILERVEEGWVPAENKAGIPGGELSQDGKEIVVVREHLSKYTVGQWLYENVLRHINKLPDPPPPDPILKMGQAGEEYYDDPTVQVKVDSPYALSHEFGKLGEMGVGGMWYKIDLESTEAYLNEGPNILAPGERHDLEIVFPDPDEEATLCLSTKGTLLRAAWNWADRLGVPDEEVDEIIGGIELILESYEHVPEGGTDFEDLLWLVKKLVINWIWEIVREFAGWKAQVWSNAVPVSIDISAYVSARTDYKADPCIEVSVQTFTSTSDTRPVNEGVIAYEEPIREEGIARWSCNGVWTINPDGSENTLVDPNGCVLDWLPGGQKLAYIIVVDRRDKVIVANPDGTDKKKVWEPSISTKIINPVYSIHDLKWSKDVNKFYALWQGNNPGGYPLPGHINNLEFVNLSTSDTKEISFGEIAYFDVSPRDDWIVFVGINYFMNTSSPTKWEETLSIMDKDGQNRQELITLDGSVEDEMHLPQWEDTTLIKFPSWSPDGKSIAFYISKPSDPPRSTILSVINADGTGLEELRQVSLEEYSLLSNGNITWSPDGKKIAYVDNGWIWIINADGKGEPQKLVKGNNPAWSPGEIPEQDTEIFESVPTVTPFTCPGAPTTRLSSGDYAYVSNEPPTANIIRLVPGIDQPIVGRVHPGEQVLVVGGPQCSNNYMWWEVEVLDTGMVGWTAEGDPENYWLISCETKEDCR